MSLVVEIDDFFDALLQSLARLPVGQLQICQLYLALKYLLVLVDHPLEGVVRELVQVKSLTEETHDVFAGHLRWDSCLVTKLFGLSWHCNARVHGHRRDIKVLVNKVSVPIVRPLYQSPEWLVLKEESLVLVEQIVQIDSVGVHEVAFDENLLVGDVHQAVSEKHARETEQTNTAHVHEPVPYKVVRHLKWKVDADGGDETHSVRHMIECHHLFQNVKLTEERQVGHVLCPHDIDELFEGRVKKYLELPLDLRLINCKAIQIRFCLWLRYRALNQPLLLPLERNFVALVISLEELAGHSTLHVLADAQVCWFAPHELRIFLFIETVQERILCVLYALELVDLPVLIPNGVPNVASINLLEVFIASIADYVHHWVIWVR